MSVIPASSFDVARIALSQPKVSGKGKTVVYAEYTVGDGEEAFTQRPVLRAPRCKVVETGPNHIHLSGEPWSDVISGLNELAAAAEVPEGFAFRPLDDRPKARTTPETQIFWATGGEGEVQAGDDITPVLKMTGLWFSDERKEYGWSLQLMQGKVYRSAKITEYIFRDDVTSDESDVDE